MSTKTVTATYIYPDGSKEVIFSGKTEIEIFEEFQKANNRLKYCNGHFYTFNDKDVKQRHKEWLESDDYAKKSWDLWYMGGIVD